MAERLRIARARMREPLVADAASGSNTNRYGSLRNYQLSSVARVAANVLRSKDGYALDGPTDETIVLPWLEHLIRRGMRFRPSTAAEGVSSHRDGVLVRLGGVWEEYDATVVTAHLPDLLDLLPASPTARARAALPHSHCTCLTVRLDPRENVITRGEVALYCHSGFTILVQPGAARCVVLCVRSRSTETGWVVQQVRRMLDLHHAIVDVRVRANHSPAEAVYTAEHLRVDEILAHFGGHIHLAGSYLRSGYPLDSAECAARTAHAAVERMRERYGLAAAVGGERSSVLGSSSPGFTSSEGGRSDRG